MKRRIIEFLILLIVAMGSAPVGAAIWNWSTTPANNATADPTIGWSEGMSPSSVNDSARAMMARIAEWRSDISGVGTTAGTSTAYTLTTLEGVNTTPSNGQMVAFIAHATNGIAPSLTVDGGNTYPIWLNGAAVGAATMIAGTPYRVSFSNSNSAWLLESGYGNPYNVPLGGILDSTISTPPNSNFILPAGQCISSTTYNSYWVAIGSPASGSCAGGQFAVIDLRGRVTAGLDNLNGTAANRLTSASTGCGTAMTSMGAVCSNGVEGFAITLSQLPTGITSSNASQSITVTPSVAIPSTTIGNLGSVGLTCCGPYAVPITNNNAAFAVAGPISGTNSISVTSNNTSGAARPNVQPTIGVYKFLRVL